MVILITGASHTGKTALAQKLLEKYKFPYLSIDHLKMGLIRNVEQKSRTNSSLRHSGLKSKDFSSFPLEVFVFL